MGTFILVSLALLFIGLCTVAWWLWRVARRIAGLGPAPAAPAAGGAAPAAPAPGGALPPPVAPAPTAPTTGRPWWQVALAALGLIAAAALVVVLVIWAASFVSETSSAQPVATAPAPQPAPDPAAELAKVKAEAAKAQAEAASATAKATAALADSGKLASANLCPGGNLQACELQLKADGATAESATLACRPTCGE